MAKIKHKHFNLTIDDDGRQSYTEGSTIRGTVTLKLSKKMAPIQNISVIFEGNASVKFTIP